MGTYIIDNDRKFGSVIVVGSLDGHTLPEFGKDVKSLLDDGIINVVFDFSELHFISSAGIGQIILTRGEILEKQGQLFIVCHNERINAGFKHAKLDQILPIYQNMEDVLSSFSE